MSIRTVCVADAATRETLRHVVEQLPQCDVVAWLDPAEARATVATFQPDLVLVAPAAATMLHEPSMPYSMPQPQLLKQGPEQSSFLRQGVVALPTVDGIELISCASIVRIKGEGSYVRFVFESRSDLVLAKTLSDCDHALPVQEFVRVHRSNIVNVNHILRIIRGKSLRLRLSNGDEVDVSERYREALLKRLPVPVRSKPW